MLLSLVAPISSCNKGLIPLDTQSTKELRDTQSTKNKMKKIKTEFAKDIYEQV